MKKEAKDMSTATMNDPKTTIRTYGSNTKFKDENKNVVVVPSPPAMYVNMFDVIAETYMTVPQHLLADVIRVLNFGNYVFKTHEAKLYTVIAVQYQKV